MKTSLLRIVGLLGLFGCGGSEIYIADSADIRVEFSRKLVQVRFHLNPAFHLERRILADFSKNNESLSKIFFDSREKSQQKELSAIFSIDSLNHESWNFSDLSKFPNWSRLPETVPNSLLKEVSQTIDGLHISSLHQSEPHLIVGGSILGDDFDFLPFGFLAHQYFKDDYGNKVASLSMAGKSLATKGGIYFVGNFGLNPFVMERVDGTLNLKSDGPLQIESLGFGSFDYSKIQQLRSF